MRLRRIILKPEFIARHPYLSYDEWERFSMRLNPMPMGVWVNSPVLTLAYADDPVLPGAVVIRNERTMH